ncbi:MAG: hypothetical protein CBE07_001420 [Pelagibacteraceae bacterium TMED247]|nr:MAG: hypothetical protein CBE07_001420 [Pelagibacteraceae bacterium TMED247]
MDVEAKLLEFFSDEAEFHGESRMGKAKNFLRGIEGTLKGEEDAEWSFEIASAMAHRGFLLNISRSDGQRERAKGLHKEADYVDALIKKSEMYHTVVIDGETR